MSRSLRKKTVSIQIFADYVPRNTPSIMTKTHKRNKKLHIFIYCPLGNTRASSEGSQRFQESVPLVGAFSVIVKSLPTFVWMKLYFKYADNFIFPSYISCSFASCSAFSCCNHRKRKKPVKTKFELNFRDLDSRWGFWGITLQKYLGSLLIFDMIFGSRIITWCSCLVSEISTGAASQIFVWG